jgi:hypothetical protein
MNCPLQARRAADEEEQRVWNKKMPGHLGVQLEKTVVGVRDKIGVGRVFYKSNMQALADDKGVGVANVFDDLGKLAQSGELCLVWAPGGECGCNQRLADLPRVGGRVVLHRAHVHARAHQQDQVRAGGRPSRR